MTEHVVALHPSLGRLSSDFDGLVVELRRAGHEVVAIDAHAVVPDGEPTLHDLAASVVAALDDAGASTADLIGHALGNRIMRTVASRHGDRVRTVTLLGAGGRVEGDDDARAALLRCFDVDLDDDAHVDAVRTAFFAPTSDVPDEWRAGWYPDLARAQGGAVRRTAVDDWWDGGTAPMLVVQGLQDRVAPVANGRLLRDQRPATTLVEIDGAGHALLPEQPDAVAAAVLRFLEG